MKRALLATFFLLLINSLYSEPLRLNISGNLTVSQAEPEGQKGTMGINDAIGITIIPSPSIQGIEIEIKIPSALSKYRGALAYSLLKKCLPAPNTSIVSYDANQILIKELPDRVSLIIQIPIRKDSTIKTSPYATLLTTLVTPEEFPMLFRIQPVVKGLSPEVEKAIFNIKVKPIFFDEGTLDLQIKYPEKKTPIEVFIDNKKITFNDSPITLTTGVHYVRIIGPEIRDENRQVLIETAKTYLLEVTLKDTTPIVIIEAPDKTQILFDSEKINVDGSYNFKVTPGDHTIVFIVGDYTISRKLTIEKGKTYTILLNIGIDIKEE